MATVEERLALLEARFATVDQREAEKAAQEVVLARSRRDGFEYLRTGRVPPVEEPPREPGEETPRDPRGR